MYTVEQESMKKFILLFVWVIKDILIDPWHYYKFVDTTFRACPHLLILNNSNNCIKAGVSNTRPIRPAIIWKLKKIKN